LEHVMLLSAGWMAGFGAIKVIENSWYLLLPFFFNKGIIKQHDHIVMDALSHNCLLEGAKASTKNVYKVKHLCNESFEVKIKELRE
jgi:glycine C-acetyltransferase